MIITIITIWCIVGIASVIHDWTKNFDYEIGDVIPSIFFGVTIGPFIGILNIYKSIFKDYKVIIKKRKS